MIRGRRVLGVIPDRGGSKEFKCKNVPPLLGKPLLTWTLEAALSASVIDRVILSKEDAEIAEVGREHVGDVPILRRRDHGTNTAAAIDVALHAADAVPGFEILVLLQPMLAMVQKRSNPLVVSVEGDEFQTRFSAGERRDRVCPGRVASRLSTLPRQRQKLPNPIDLPGAPGSKRHKIELE